jgi:hypothetical protein
VALALIVIATACEGSHVTSNRPDGRLKEIVTQGVSDIERTHDMEALHKRLLRRIARLRTLQETTPPNRRARALALRGFEETLRGVDSRLSLARNDSGKLEAAVRDAIRADRALKAGARDLRAVGRELGVRVGVVLGY